MFTFSILSPLCSIVFSRYRGGEVLEELGKAEENDQNIMYKIFLKNVLTILHYPSFLEFISIEPGLAISP